MRSYHIKSGENRWMQEKKEDILYIYTVEVEIRDEKVWLRRHPKEKNV